MSDCCCSSDGCCDQLQKIVIDGKVVSYGKVLKAEEVVKILQKVR